VADVESLRKETQPPRRFTEASLLGAMETAGKDIDDAELREAMKDSGIGTPATRAAIIERLIDVGYIEREGRALIATEKGLDVIENRKGYSCWSKDDPGCGFVIWKKKANKILPVSVVKELMATGKTAKPVTGFRGRSGRTFRAKLKLEQNDEGKWRVEFDEDWAREPRAEPSEEEGAPAGHAAPASPDGGAPAAEVAERS